MTKPNYELKAMILDQHPDWIQMVREARKFDWLVAQRRSPVLDNDMEKYEESWFMLEGLAQGSPDLCAECEKIVDADKQRKKRLRKRIERIVSKGRAYFITLTFNDETLAATDAKTRRTYVARFLKSISPDFVGNVDFGALNGREHYHAVIYSTALDDIKYKFTKAYGWICSDCPQFLEWSRLGFYSIKSCGTEKTDLQKLSWYVSKLTNHAIKETTKRSALIFSR